MKWTGLAAHYGFQRPYDFKIAVPFLLNLCGFALVLGISIFLYSTGGLDTGTERFYFFAYLAVLLLGAVALSRVTFLSVTALLWCVLELGLALASSTFDRNRHESNAALLPRNIFTVLRDDRYVYHPLFQRALKPGWQQSVRYDGRNKNLLAMRAALAPEFFDRDIVFTHNSLGMRGAEITADDLSRPMIFVYGGSTTYDYTVTQGETWVERLEAELKNSFTILNFGVPGHSTAEHVIHASFYQDMIGKKPVCSIYYVGWNDITSAHTENLDPAYANFHSLNIAERKPEIWAAKYSPLLRLFYRAMRGRLDSIPEATNFYGNAPKSGTDSRLEHIFSDHITTIAAINGARGIRTIFIGQMLNRQLLNSTPPHGMRLWPMVADKEVWPLQARFNSVLQETALSVGARFIDPGIDNFAMGDFADVGHFSSAGSSKFAGLIATQIDSYCQ